MNKYGSLAGYHAGDTIYLEGTGISHVHFITCRKPYDFLGVFHTGISLSLAMCSGTAERPFRITSLDHTRPATIHVIDGHGITLSTAGAALKDLHIHIDHLNIEGNNNGYAGIFIEESEVGTLDFLTLKEVSVKGLTCNLACTYSSGPRCKCSLAGNKLRRVVV